MTNGFNHTTCDSTQPAPATIIVEGRNLTEIILDAERKTLAWAMTETQGNQRQAAKLLNVSYNTFKAKIARHNLRAVWS